MLQQHTALFLPVDRDDEWQASPADYLDKIFQIPYALRPIGGQAGTYIRSLLPEVVQQVLPPTVRTQSPGPTAAEASPTQANPPEESVTPTISRGRDVDLETPQEKAEHFTDWTPARRVDDLRPEGLRLSAVEREFLPRVGPLLPTPRSAKRLVNLYRLLRIGVPEAELPAFVGGEDGGPYQAAAVLLATVIGMPSDARKLLATLRDVDPAEDIVTLRGSAGLHRLADLVEAIREDILGYGRVATYQEWGRTVARYSFETYDLFLSGYPDSNDLATGPTSSSQSARPWLGSLPAVTGARSDVPWRSRAPSPVQRHDLSGAALKSPGRSKGSQHGVSARRRFGDQNELHCWSRSPAINPVTR